MTTTHEPPGAETHAVSANGYLSAEAALSNAPLDLDEQDVEGVFGGKVRIRALTAAQQAAVKQAGVSIGGSQQNVAVSFGAIERKQFELGVIAPAFTAEQVRTLHATSGPSFTRVIEALDKLSGMNKEALRDAQKAFQGPGE
jgi:hypothetical protein